MELNLSDAPMKFIGFTGGMGNLAGMPKGHFHNEIELNYLPNGSMTYIFGGRMIVVPPQTLVVFWGSIPHRVVCREEGTRNICFTIPLAWFLNWDLPKPIVKRLLNGSFLQDSEKGNQELDCQLFMRWAKEFDRNDSGVKKILLLELQARILRFSRNAKVRRSKFVSKDDSKKAHALALIEKLSRFIAENYLEALTLKEIAAAAHLHPNYAANLFKQTLNITIFDYLTRLRLSHAQSLLASTEQNVLDVALDSGFGSANRFYLAFQKYCHCTPKQYRKAIRESGE